MSDVIAAVTGDSANLLILDITTATVLDTIVISDVGTGLAITPDASEIYVPIGNAGSSVQPISYPALVSAAPISVGMLPRQVAITPDGTKGYSADYNSNTATPFTIPGNVAGTPISVGSNPYGVCISPDGTTAYVACNGPNTIDVIDVATDTVIHTITGISNARSIAITADGAHLYCSGTFSGLYKIALPGYATSNLGGTGTSNWVTLTPDGTKAYVSDSSNNQVWPVDLSTFTLGTAIATGGAPIGGQVDALSQNFYLCVAGLNEVFTIDVATEAILTSTGALGGAYDLALIMPPAVAAPWVVGMAA